MTQTYGRWCAVWALASGVVAGCGGGTTTSTDAASARDTGVAIDAARADDASGAGDDAASTDAAATVDAAIDCPSITDATACAAETRCRWLTHGCGIVAQTFPEGCYAAADCTGPDDCIAGYACTLVTYHPVSDNPELCGADASICIDETL